MTSQILVTGGTGTLGRQVVPLLQKAGLGVRVLSRSDHDATDGVAYVSGDISTGEGLDAAVDGVGTILHLAGSTTGDEDKARHLVEAIERNGGRPHLVYVSVVGADRVPVVSGIDRAQFGYMASKLAAEQVITESGLPWTILRATQFHDFVLMLLTQMAKTPLVLPIFAGVRFQPVDASEVAARLVELAQGEPAGRVPDLAGPLVHTMDEMARDYLRATGKRRLIVPMKNPGKAAAAYRAGANLAEDGATLGTITWEQFLSRQVPATT